MRIVVKNGTSTPAHPGGRLTIRHTEAQGREFHYRTLEARDWLRSLGVTLPGERQAKE